MATWYSGCHWSGLVSWYWKIDVDCEWWCGWYSGCHWSGLVSWYWRTTWLQLGCTTCPATRTWYAHLCRRRRWRRTALGRHCLSCASVNACVLIRHSSTKCQSAWRSWLFFTLVSSSYCQSPCYYNERWTLCCEVKLTRVRYCVTGRLQTVIEYKFPHFIYVVCYLQNSQQFLFCYFGSL